MALRETNPERLTELMEQVSQEWDGLSAEERVELTLEAFMRTFGVIAEVAYEVEASQGHIALESRERDKTLPLDHPKRARVRDYIASDALALSKTLPEAIDGLEARQQIIAVENFGDESPTGQLSETLVVLINQLRPIAEVIQDAAATVKSGTMTTVQRNQERKVDS